MHANPSGALGELYSCAIIHTHLVNDPHFLISKGYVHCEERQTYSIGKSGKLTVYIGNIFNYN
jgi:hypothetical protein